MINSWYGLAVSAARCVSMLSHRIYQAGVYRFAGRRSRWGRLLLDIENLTLKPISFGQQGLSPLPTVPGPPAQFFRKGHTRKRLVSYRSMLKIISVMPLLVLPKAFVLVVIQSLSLFSHVRRAVRSTLASLPSPPGKNLDGEDPHRLRGAG